MLPYDIFDTLPRDCWVTINSAQLAENIRRLQMVAGCPILAVIKANGYGHGYENAAKAFLKGGATYLGVATLSEGLLLRKLGITAPVLVICGMLPPEITLAAEAGLDFFVWRPDHIKALREIAAKHPVRAHLKVDTGMGRGGCLPDEAAQIAMELQAIKGVEITGLCTHFASADVPGIDDTDRQIAKFDMAIAALAAAGIRPRIIHAANSPGGLYYPKARYDMVRFGIVCYGVPPDGDCWSTPDGVKSALTWHAKITSTKILPAGHGVGYGGAYKLSAPKRIGVLPVGYGDGFRRIVGVNTVLVDGQERKVLGRVCMDQCMIDLDGFGDITGAEIMLIGQQGNAEISTETLARRWNTNPYEVFTGIAARVPRRVR
jgi:alanine racemase